ncbi:hypothetical protein BV20DRAFT_959012, partial [Pilatotrama ljubarskyi]
LSPLVQDMVQDGPTKRPTMQEVTQCLDALIKSLGRWKVRSRLIPRDKSSLEGVFREISHTFRNARYIFARKSAIPSLIDPFTLHALLMLCAIALVPSL